MIAVVENRFEYDKNIFFYLPWVSGMASLFSSVNILIEAGAC
jgi:hypothetical protein